MFRLTKNTKNSENEPNYQDLPAFPVGTSYRERGNNRTVMDERFRSAAGRLAKLEAMEKRLQAVYKHGALYPLEPLQLQDMQEVTLTITDTSSIDEDLAGYFTAEEWREAATDTVTWDEVRRALAGISGSLSDAVSAQRQER